MTTIDNRINWNVEINSITCSLEQKKKVLSKEEIAYETVATQVNALTQTDVFQNILKQLPKDTPPSLRVEVTGTTFQIFNNDQRLFDSTQENNSKSAPYQEAVDKINRIATQALHPPTPHGISNENVYCFANSAYQLLANIPSLRMSVLEQLPASYDTLKDYSKILSGQTLVETWNQCCASPQEQFDLKHGHMASEFLERVIGKCKVSSLPTLITTSTRKNPKNPSDKTVTKEAPAAFIGLQTTATGDFLDFNAVLKQGLETTNPPNKVKDGEVESSTSYFKSSPKQLFLKVDRFKNGKKDDRPLKNIPHLLDTTSLIGKDTPATNLELKGFLVHKGTGQGTVGGHYVAYIKIEDAQQPGQYHWVCANDSTITSIEEEQLNQELKQASDLYYDNTLTNTSKSIIVPASSQRT